MSLVRNPALWTGVALITVGGGNWINGQTKLAEYQVIAAQTEVASVTEPEEYPYLDERATLAVLEPLRSGLTKRTFVDGKREFYGVVLTGGRLLVLFGAFLLVTATYWENRRAAASPP